MLRFVVYALVVALAAAELKWNDNEAAGPIYTQSCFNFVNDTFFDLSPLRQFEDSYYYNGGDQYVYHFCDHTLDSNCLTKDNGRDNACFKNYYGWYGASSWDRAMQWTPAQGGTNVGIAIKEPAMSSSYKATATVKCDHEVTGRPKLIRGDVSSYDVSYTFASAMACEDGWQKTPCYGFVGGTKYTLSPLRNLNLAYRDVNYTYHLHMCERGPKCDGPVCQNTTKWTRRLADWYATSWGPRTDGVRGIKVELAGGEEGRSVSVNLQCDSSVDGHLDKAMEEVFVSGHYDFFVTSRYACAWTPWNACRGYVNSTYFDASPLRQFGDLKWSDASGNLTYTYAFCDRVDVPQCIAQNNGNACEEARYMEPQPHRSVHTLSSWDSSMYWGSRTDGVVGLKITTTGGDGGRQTQALLHCTDTKFPHITNVVNQYPVYTYYIDVPRSICNL